MGDRRVAVVTGGAQGLGWAISQRLARDGFELVILDRQAGAKDKAEELAGAGLHASAVIADLADEASLRAAAAGILDRLGRCDVLVNNAGVHFKKDGNRVTFEAVTPDDWARTIAVNLTAPLLLGQAFVPGMKARRWGRVINMSSRAGRTYTAPANPSYAATKAGIIGLTRSMAGEFAPYGITCNCIAPGRFKTPMTDAGSPAVREAAMRELPVGRLGEPMEIGAMCAFLASDESGFITGAVLDVNGGSFMG